MRIERIGDATLHTGCCLDVLKTLPDESVQTCVTSPPYFGLRDYNCDGQIGLEPTPDEYVAKMVSVFAEVRRVLRDDGTVWLNLGDSYCGGGRGGNPADSPHRKQATNVGSLVAPTPVSNASDFIHRQLKGVGIFIGQAYSRGLAAKSLNVFLYDEAAPDRVLKPFLGAQWVTIKQGNDNLCEISNGLNTPIRCFISRSFLLADPSTPNSKGFVDDIKNLRVVITAGNLNSDSSIRSSVTLPVKNSKATFAIEVPAEPIPKVGTNVEPVWYSITVNASTKSSLQINTINKSVAFTHGFGAATNGLSDFIVTESSLQKFEFTLVHSGLKVAVFAVAHINISYADGSLIPVQLLYKDAIAYANENRAKQELGMPEMVKRALMRDGWICRQTIIWSKPNPMPESVTDRCTKAHEYIFLLSKNAQYYYDQDAILEPVSPNTNMRLSQNLAAQIGSHRAHGGTKTNGPMKAVGRKASQGKVGREKQNPSFDQAICLPVNLRNKRSVWTVGTKAYPEAHFATFPPDLIEPCILAGCPVGGAVLDPFSGSGTTGQVALQNSRKYIGIELNQEYQLLAAERIGPVAAQGRLFA